MWTQFALCLFIILLFLLAKDDKKRLKYILPIAFIIVTFFFAIRYDYGNDYWHYYGRWAEGRKVEGNNRGTGEFLFYGFMQLFDKYYKFIIAQSILFCTCLFLLVRKYIAPKYFALFFLFFMTLGEMSYGLMTAMRNSLAACVIWIACDYFYIQKKLWLPYIALVGVASLFHTSSLLFLIVPLLDLFINKASPRLLFVLIFIGTFVNAIYGAEITTYLLNLFPFMMETYGDYLGGYATNSATIYGAINKSALLFPYFFICMGKKDILIDKKKTRIWILAIIIILLRSWGLDILGRLSLTLFVFVVISLTNILQKLSSAEKLICLAPIFVHWAYNSLYLFYKANVMYQFGDANMGDGSFLFYHTLFDATWLP